MFDTCMVQTCSEFAFLKNLLSYNSHKVFKGLAANAADRDSDAEVESNAYADITCKLQSCDAGA